MTTKPKIYHTQTALSMAENIPLTHIRAAKSLSAKGMEDGKRINWNEFEPWYRENLDAIGEYLADNDTQTAGKGVWKERKERALALIAEIELREREFKTLDKDKVTTFLKQIAGSQAIVLRNMAQELPQRLLGKGVTDMGVILASGYDDVCSIFKESLNKWIKN